MSLHRLRHEYTLDALTESRAPRSPWRLFAAWFEQALALDGPDRNAMVLATSDARGRPSSRMVLLKHWDERGFVFGTNYRSRKGREAEARPRVALLFYWPELERQVRVEGPIARVSPAESDALFLARPRAARLGALASPQSRVVPARRALESALAAWTTRHDGREVHRPAQWGGYRVGAAVFEFWQGRPNRLHDRLRYRRVRGGWKRDRLAP